MSNLRASNEIPLSSGYQAGLAQPQLAKAQTASTFQQNAAASQGLAGSGGYGLNSGLAGSTGLSGAQGGFAQGFGAQPIIQNTVVAAPVVQETIRNDRIIEVQPVIHREVDKNVVHHIEKHIHEAAAPSMGGVIERPPLLQQTVRTNVVHEIQPIIHRERVIPVAERVEQHLTQRVVEAPVHTHEVVYERQNLGFAGQQYAGQQFGQQQFGQQQFTQTSYAPMAGAGTLGAVPIAPTTTSSRKHHIFHRS